MEQQDLSTGRLENEIARLTIERDRYRAALLDLKTQLWKYWNQATQGNDKTITLAASEVATLANHADIETLR